mgnify:CR=1 FL=1
MITDVERLKKIAGEKAAEQVTSGMRLGLGTGSTAKFFVMKLGELWQAKQLTDIVGVPTSNRTAEVAQAYGLPLATLNEVPHLDLAVDGADEIDPQLNLIKGGGGALLREKMVESAAKRLIIVGDQGKLVQKLGQDFALPVEIVPFGWRTQLDWLATLGCQPVLRGGESEPYLTDNGNFIIDCTFPKGIDDPLQLAETLIRRVGVVEHGLFLNMVSEVILAGVDGLQILKP